MAKQIRPVIVYGNDTTLYIRMKRFDKSTGDYIDFSMEQVTDLSVSLICSQHNTDIPLTFTVDGNLITCAIEYRLLHPNASYGIIVEGIDEDQKHFRFEMLSREGFLVVSNTSGMRVDDNIETIDIQGRVGWGISYNGDLTNYYTKSEVDNLIAEIEIDLSDYYTKEEINQLVNQFPTKSEIDTRFNDYYTKTQVNGLISDLEDIVDDKQDTLVSGANIKTINNESILGSGNIDIQGGGGSVEPIIVNYNEVIPDETIAKIKEQKANVMMYDADTKHYYQLLRLTQRSNYIILEFGVFYKNPSDTRQVTVMMYSYKKYDNSPGTWTFNFNYLDDSYKIENLLSNKQDNLVSGSNIKTINNESILGEGNIDIQAGEDYSEQFKTTADALWDLDNRLNRSEYITNKKLESIEDSTKDALDEFGDNINEQLSVAANTLIEHSERLAVQSDWNESDSSSLAYIQNKPTISTPVQSDWNETNTTSLAYIQNKPSITQPVQSDWNETDTTSLAYIQNKPTIQQQAIDQYIIDANYDSINKRLYFRFATCMQDANGTIYEPNRLYEAPRIFAEIKDNRNLVYTLYTNNNSININSFLSSIVRSGRDHYLPIPTTIGNITIDEGTILNFRISTFSPWQIESHQNIYITIPKTGLVTSSTVGLKIEVVSALPATPDANTIYVIQ